MSCPGAVSGDNTEMEGGIRIQETDVCSDILIAVPTLVLRSGRKPVAGRGPILERDSRGQSMWIERAI